MSEPIKAGDLVVVVGAHCAASSMYLGTIFVAQAVGRDIAHCSACYADLGWQDYARDEHGLAFGFLKRIDPLTEPEDVEHKEEMPA